MTEEFDWSLLSGMNEDKAEDYMMKNWGEIPQEWNDPLFRDSVTGVNGQAELSAHMNFGTQAYGSEKKLGDDAAGVWERRNIDGQGHPAEADFKNASIKKGERKG